jgi:hypothetical protein
VGLSDRLNLQVILPFVHREHQHVHHHHGTDLVDSWNFTGMGDLTLLSRFALLRNAQTGFRVSAIAGGKLPTGRDHILNADGDEAEVGILPGSGAFSLILGGAVSTDFTAPTANGLYARMPVFFSSTYQWNGKGTDDYRLGNTWLANVGTAYPVLPRLGFLLQGNLRVARRDDRGSTFEEIRKTGGTFVYISPGVQLALAENLWSYLLVQVPVYQRVNGIQLTSDANIVAGASYRFSLL